MRRIRYIIPVLLIAVLLGGCAENKKCDYNEAAPALAGASEVYAYVYSKEQGYTISGNELSGMLDGEWSKSSKGSDFDKVLSLVIDTQYEICLFSDGTAMIYCGYSGIFQTDREYYSCKLDKSLDEICSFVIENGTETTKEK